MGTDEETPNGAAEPLSPEDATLLCATTAQAQLQIGALCRFEGAPLRDSDGTLRVADLRDHVASRLHRVPRLRQRLRHVPFDLARPVWVDDAQFDVAHHVRAMRLPAPGGPAELRAFMGALLGTPLDPVRPLWDLWLVDGLADGDVAVVLRTHHVVADGLSLLRHAVAMLDFEADPPPDPADPSGEPWQPSAAPAPLALVASGLVERSRHQVGLAVGAAVGLAVGTARALADPRRVVGLARPAVSAITAPPQRAPGLPLTGRVGTHRDFLWTSLPLEALRAVAHSHGVTLNDVVLAVVADALRRLLGTETAAALAEHPPKVLVPIGDTSGDDGGNAFSFVVTALPVDLEDPERLIARIHSDMAEHKASDQALDALSLFSIVDVVPLPVLRLLAPELLARQPFVNLAVTNIPGSEVPLYLLGSRLRELHPIITGVGNIACIIGVLSYEDRLGVSVTVDPDVVPDADRFLDALTAASNAVIAASRS